MGTESQDGERPSHESSAAAEHPIHHTTSSTMEKQVRQRRADRSDPFGDESPDAEIKYRTMIWWQATVIMIAETVSLGVLSLPNVLASVGLVAGLILIVGLGLIATYTGYVIGQFKMAYPHVHNMADAGEVLLGRVGGEVFGVAQTVFLSFGVGSHVLTFTIGMNAVTGHATCTIVWAVVGSVVMFVCTLPRTLRMVSYPSAESSAEYKQT